MPYRVKLPQVGESVTEAVIGKWLKKPGEHVEKFDPIVEVVTDKVSMEFPAPAAGTLTKILHAEGATVPMGVVIAEMELDDPGAAPADEGTPAGESGEASAETGPIGRVGRIVSGANVGPTGGVFAEATHGIRGVDAGRSSGAGAPARPDVGDLTGRYSPVVVRLAAQHGIELRSVRGTGIGGRVTKQDVLAAAESRGPETGLAAGSRQVAAPPEPRSAGAPAGPAAPTAAPEDRLIEPSPVRKIIASRMVRSVAEIPHAWTAVEVDVAGMVACRETRKEDFQRRNGVDLSYVAFTMHAIAAALRSNPIVNSIWEYGKIRVKGRVSIGLAVAAPHGLVVPVVHDADRLSIAEIAAAVAPLVERARNDRLAQPDVRDGTFTLNNTGALGSVWGRAIINYPQAAILNTEAI
ncbi:MAG: 2-oxo acid dehydrogenase subunit E2, partial [Chloroflexi bacterium]|nr:2-oxo acid dehydrogenase subunit E2 [Chloroflexota bacterium]